MMEKFLLIVLIFGIIMSAPGCNIPNVAGTYVGILSSSEPNYVNASIQIQITQLGVSITAVSIVEGENFLTVSGEIDEDGYFTMTGRSEPPGYYMVTETGRINGTSYYSTMDWLWDHPDEPLFTINFTINAVKIL